MIIFSSTLAVWKTEALTLIYSQKKKKGNVERERHEGEIVIYLWTCPFVLLQVIWTHFEQTFCELNFIKISLKLHVSYMGMLNVFSHKERIVTLKMWFCHVLTHFGMMILNSWHKCPNRNISSNSTRQKTDWGVFFMSTMPVFIFFSQELFCIMPSNFGSWCLWKAFFLYSHRLRHWLTAYITHIVSLL